MKSRQFTLGLLALILTQLLSFKTLAQCCVAPENLLVVTVVHCPIGFPNCLLGAHLSWARAPEAGCTTPVKYKLEIRAVGDTIWRGFIVTTSPDATVVDTTIGLPKCFLCTFTFEWRVRGICSATNKSAWVYGKNYTDIASPPFTTSSASDASSQGKFTVTAYPNPVAGELKLSGHLKARGSVNVQIINSVGQTVLHYDYNLNSGDFRTSVDVSKLPPGVYLVIVNNKTERATSSIIKQ
jgi:hypothetical protein